MDQTRELDATLSHEQLEQVFEKFVSELHVRAFQQAGAPLLIRISPEARDVIIARGSDLTLGARPLGRAVEAARARAETTVVLP